MDERAWNLHGIDFPYSLNIINNAASHSLRFPRHDRCATRCRSLSLCYLKRNKTKKTVKQKNDSRQKKFGWQSGTREHRHQSREHRHQREQREQREQSTGPEQSTRERAERAERAPEHQSTGTGLERAPERAPALALHGWQAGIAWQTSD